jgi:hypothetical protein
MTNTKKKRPKEERLTAVLYVRIQPSALEALNEAAEFASEGQGEFVRAAVQERMERVAMAQKEMKR